MSRPTDSPHTQIDVLLAEASASARPLPQTCLGLARAFDRHDEPQQALRWAFAASDASESLVDWLAAGAVARRCLPRVPELPRRARVAVLGSYTTAQYAAILPLAAARAGVAIEVYESGYGQYRQEVLDPTSGLYSFGPDIVIFAVHAGELALPETSDDPEAEVDREVARWTGLWQTVTDRCGARVIQHTFALPAQVPLGHFSGRTSSSGYALQVRTNARLAEVAGDEVAIVDCERLASTVGKQQWFDARYWFRSKQAVALGQVPLLARHTAAVVASLLGQSRKCLVLDLDNTLWGGVLGEDGLEGLQLGQGAVGEAFSAFQEYILALKARGIILAICSKNNPDDAREVFEKHPDMRLSLDDIALFSAGWEDKATQVRQIAATLGIGLDSLVFVDDNPAEREVVRQLVPEVDVLPLPSDPAGYLQALADYPFFEPASVTAEDADRTRLYRARADTAQLQQSADSLDDFLRTLSMVATVTPVDSLAAPRVAQLIGKTNQFNLTGRRRSLAEVSALLDDPDAVVLGVRLRDRFSDHGLVGVMIGLVSPDAVLTVDTWLLSCRVIGRTLEHELLREMAAAARAHGCTSLRGSYRPSAKNALVADLYPRLGFRSAPPEPTTEPTVTSWDLSLTEVPASPGFITVNPGPKDAS